MRAANQTGLVGMMADRHEVEIAPVRPQDDGGTRDRKLADPALAEAPADHDALDLGPALQPGETADDEGQRLGKAFDGTVHQCSRPRIALLDQRVELLLADLGSLALQRIVAVALEVAAQRVEMFDEGAAARLVADETVIVADLQIVAGDHHGGQFGGTMRAGCGLGRPA